MRTAADGRRSTALHMSPRAAINFVVCELRVGYAFVYRMDQGFSNEREPSTLTYLIDLVNEFRLIFLRQCQNVLHKVLAVEEGGDLFPRRFRC